MGKVFIGNFKGPKGDKGDQGAQGIQGIQGPAGPTGEVDENTPIEFTEASTLSNINSGESISTIFGKLKKIAGSLLIGAGSTLLGQNLTAARALVSDVNGKVGISTTTATELQYLSGLTKNAQEQFNQLTEKLIPFNFKVPEGSDINDDAFCKFGFFSGRNLVNAPTTGWFQWLTFPMNGNIEYPAQLGYAVNGVNGSVRQYARMKNTEPSGTLSWKNWIEVATKDYVDDKILVIDKIITLPEGATTRGVVEVSVDYGSRRIMSYSVLAAESGASFHVQAAYTGDGKLTFVYDKQGTNSFNVTLRLIFI